MRCFGSRLSKAGAGPALPVSAGLRVTTAAASAALEGALLESGPVELRHRADRHVELELRPLCELFASASRRPAAAGSERCVARREITNCASSAPANSEPSRAKGAVTA